MDDGNLGPLRAEMKQCHQRVVEKLQEMTIEVAKAFNTYSYVRADNRRVIEFEGKEPDFGSRLATLEDRILVCERRLNIPPAAEKLFQE